MLHRAAIDGSFASWRTAARAMLAADAPPETVLWSIEPGLLDGLATAAPGFAPRESSPLQSNSPPADVEKTNSAIARVPRRFLDAADAAACHRDNDKWQLLYRILWRLARKQSRLMEIESDPDIRRLLSMEKSVNRDVHKMHAFVRFRKVMETSAGGEEAERFIAWHRPDHLIVRRAAPFFVRRFSVMRWSILTPDASASWDGDALVFGAGCPRSAAPADDELESLWRSYYGAIFNPARIKLHAMRKEMPVRHWSTLPETQVIDELLREAPGRMDAMLAQARLSQSQLSQAQPAQSPGAQEFLPPAPASGKSIPLKKLSAAAQTCKGCPLYQHATQTVFGQGPAQAACMLVGEQPGDQEDKVGEPFVGPAGQLLDRALVDAGMQRTSLYVTNAVKHFKFEQRGKRRIHGKPSAREVSACKPWLEAEIAAVAPKLIVCLGSTASQALLGPAFRVTQSRGVLQRGTAWAPLLMATVHPSSLLRIPEPAARDEAYTQFVNDLRTAAHALRGS